MAHKIDACRYVGAMRIQRFAAFTNNPNEGNPAGIVIAERFPTDDEMQAIAADVGYSETVFAVAQPDGDIRVRYFSPAVEVAFCGHATIALAVAMSASQSSSWTLRTNIGTVPVSVARDEVGEVRATLTSAHATAHHLDEALADELLRVLRLERNDLDPDYLPAIGNSGNLHPVVVLQDRLRLRGLDPDLEALRALCLTHQWITIQVVVRDAVDRWSSRNPFPIGGVAEDPATGSAAIALGAVLRSIAPVPLNFEIEQGRDMGRPSQLFVSVPTIDGPISVSGTAVEIKAV
jgi:PhzF family phenazine biosynthesis protein